MKSNLSAVLSIVFSIVTAIVIANDVEQLQRIEPSKLDASLFLIDGVVPKEIEESEARIRLCPENILNNEPFSREIYTAQLDLAKLLDMQHLIHQRIWRIDRRSVYCNPPDLDVKSQLGKEIVHREKITAALARTNADLEKLYTLKYNVTIEEYYEKIAFFGRHPKRFSR